MSAAFHATLSQFQACPRSFLSDILPLPAVFICINRILDAITTVWPSGLRRCVKAAVRKGVGSNPTAVTFKFSQPIDDTTAVMLYGRRVWPATFAMTISI